MSQGGRSLSDLLAAAEKRKHESIRQKLGIPPELKIEGLQLESLAYHLMERSGLVHIRLEEGEALRVGDSSESKGLVYRGDSVDFLLQAWNLTREQARNGILIEVSSGKRVDSKPVKAAKTR